MNGGLGIEEFLQFLAICFSTAFVLSIIIIIFSLISEWLIVKGDD